MDNEMIERVAKALWDEDQERQAKFGFSNEILYGKEWARKPVPWEYMNGVDVIDYIAKQWRDKAILVIKAMREPTDKMLDAALDCGADRDPSEYYQAMIDAVIND